MTPLPLLQRREIEAGVVAPLVRAFAAEVGEDRARAVLAGVVRELARQGGCAAAEAAGANDLAALKGVVERWRAGGALELTVLRDDAGAFAFDVTRCRYAEMYRRLGLADLGAVLSCSRDAAMIEGFNPDIGFARTQTILGGATHCDFRYRAPAGPS
ncbi:MAG: L-2-amino-thiazoline-4-carboxylic acid hydrolase [Gemmataceae bacterium]|nr:L-2-amino-thiazoline-4-carboxylic acid hydrolase [Gemmataceae bacterium]